MDNNKFNNTNSENCKNSQNSQNQNNQKNNQILNRRRLIGTPAGCPYLHMRKKIVYWFTAK